MVCNDIHADRTEKQSRQTFENLEKLSKTRIATRSGEMLSPVASPNSKFSFKLKLHPPQLTVFSIRSGTAVARNYIPTLDDEQIDARV